MAQARMTLAERKSHLEQRRLKVQTALTKRRNQVKALEARAKQIDQKLKKVEAALEKRKQG